MVIKSYRFCDVSVNGSCQQQDTKGLDEREIDGDEWNDFSEDGAEEKNAAMPKSLEVANGNGISEEDSTMLQDLVEEYSGVLRLGFGKGLPADVNPMFVELYKDARLVRAAQRR